MMMNKKILINLSFCLLAISVAMSFILKYKEDSNFFICIIVLYIAGILNYMSDDDR